MKEKLKVGFDPGFGYVKIATLNGTDLTVNKFPSVVASNKKGGDDLIEYNGLHYYTGKAALLQNVDDIENIDNYQKLEEFSPILLLDALKRAELLGKDIEIVCGLSLAQATNADAFTRCLRSFKANGKEWTFDVAITPQGVGAAKAINKHLAESENSDVKNYILFDIGHNTVDVVVTIDGKIVPAKLGGYENMGAVNIARMMQKHVEETFGRNISIKEAINIIDEGFYKLRGENHDLSVVIGEFKTSYTADLMKFLEKNYANEFDKMDAVFFVGGGAYFIDKSYDKHIRVPEYPEYMNAIGNLLV